MFFNKAFLEDGEVNSQKKDTAFHNINFLGCKLRKSPSNRPLFAKCKIISGFVSSFCVITKSLRIDLQ